MLPGLDGRTREIRSPIRGMPLVHGYGRPGHIDKVPEHGSDLFVVQRRVGWRWLIGRHGVVRMDCKCPGLNSGIAEAVVELLRDYRVELNLASFNNHVIVIGLFHVALIFVFFGIHVCPNGCHRLLQPGAFMSVEILDRLQPITLRLLGNFLASTLTYEPVVAWLIVLQNELRISR